MTSEKYGSKSIDLNGLESDRIDPQRLVNALHCCLPLAEEDSDVIEFIAEDVADEIESMQSADVLAQLSLAELEDLPIFSLLSAHLGDLLGETPSSLLVSSILDAYWAPLPVADEEDVRYALIRECELCDRRMPLTDHHLLPRSEHARLVKRELSTLDECRTRIAKLCRPCHSSVHRAASTRDLADKYNTVELLLTLDEVAKFAAYASKQRPNSSGNRHGLKDAR